MSDLPIRFVVSDGGRKASGRRGFVGDCVVRSICIVSGRPYEEVYMSITRRGRVGKKPYRKHYSARQGVISREAWFREYMDSIGFEWHKVQRGVPISSPVFACGRFVLDIRRHYTAMLDGVLHDTYDCSLDGRRKVCGYWSLRKNDLAPQGVIE